MKIIRCILLIVLAIVVTTLTFSFGFLEAQPGQTLKEKLASSSLFLVKQQNRPNWITWDTTCGFRIDIPKNWGIYHKRDCSQIDMDSTNFTNSSSYTWQVIEINRVQKGALDRFQGTSYVINTIADDIEAMKRDNYYRPTDFIFSEQPFSYQSGKGTLVIGSPTYAAGPTLSYFFFEYKNAFYAIHNLQCSATQSSCVTRLKQVVSSLLTQ